MTLGGLILLGLVAAEVVTAVKVSKQSKRIGELEEQAQKQKKKES